MCLAEGLKDICRRTPPYEAGLEKDTLLLKSVAGKLIGKLSLDNVSRTFASGVSVL